MDEFDGNRSDRPRDATWSGEFTSSSDSSSEALSSPSALRIQDNSQLFDLKILLSLVSCMILYRIFLRDLLCISCDPKADRDSDGPINFLIKRPYLSKRFLFKLDLPSVSRDLQRRTLEKDERGRR